MAVSKSPFSKGNKGGSDGGNRFNPKYDTSGLENIDKLIAAGKIKQQSSNTSDFADIGTKTTLGEEKRKLDSAYDTALSRIATSSMSDKDKDRYRKKFEQLYKTGKSDVDVSGFNPFNPVDYGRAALKGVKEVATSILDGAEFVSRAGQVGLKYTPSFGPVAGLKAVGIIQSAPITEDPRKTLSNIKKDVTNKDFRLVKQTGNKYIDAIVDFGVDVAFDPLTYVGVGPVKYLGKLGRTELAVKLGTTEMLAKYPQLVGKMDDIIRYGVGAVPKEVRAAEGIEFGVRFGGKILPKTEAIAQSISGRYGALTTLRNAVGDNVARAGQFASKQWGYEIGKLTPSSRAGMVVAGLGRGKGLDDQTVINQIANYTSAKYAKGFKAQAYNRNLDGVRDLLKEIKKAGAEQRVAVLADDAEALLREPDVYMRDLATRYKAWQDSVLEEVNAVRMKFNADFGADMKLVNKLDDYGVHHKLTEKAFRFAYGPQGRATGFFRDADLSPMELGQNTGAAMHRRYTAGQEFMGEELKTGTINEINKIFREKTGQNFDFFETDIFAIADSYAYSMATARSREAYVRRLLDFGGDTARVINKELVPDKELVALLKDSHVNLVAARNNLKRKVNAGRTLAKGKAEDAVKYARKVLDEKDIAKDKLSKDMIKIADDLLNLETKLGEAYVVASKKGDEARGAFMEIHGKLIEDVRVLRTAIEAGRGEEVAAYEALKDVYIQMFPDAKRIPKSASKMLDKITLNMGIKDTTELRVLEKQLAALQKQMGEIAPVDQQALNDLMDIEQNLLEQIDGFESLANVKLEADYAEDGFLYGDLGSFTPKPFDPNAEPMYRYASTRPTVGTTTGMNADELAAMRNAMLEDPNTVAVHALRPDEMLDMRTPEAFYDFWDPDNGVGEAVGYALRTSGADPEDVFMSMWNDVMDGAPIDPMFEQVYPEMADLMTVISTAHTHEFPYGVVDDEFNVQLFNTVKEMFQKQASSMGLENSDVVGEQMMTNFMRAMVEEGTGGRPMLLPSRFLDEADEAAEGSFIVLFPDSYNYAERFGKKTLTDDLMTGAGAPVQTASGNEFLRTVVNGDYHTAALDANELLDAVTATGREMQEGLAAREAIAKDIRKTSGKIGGEKSAGSRRMKAAQKAYDDFVESGMVSVNIDGRDIRVTREKALEILAKKEANLNRKVENLMKRIDAISGQETGSLLNRKRQLEERLVSLHEQVKVIERWNAKTGDALRQDIDLVKTAIATDPPQGWAGTNSRIWSERVTRRMEAIDRLEGSTVKDAWERVVTQLHADEAQLALLEFDAIPRAAMELTDAQLGIVGGQLRDNILDGWQALESTGVMIPDEFAKVIRPNVDKLKKAAEQALWLRAIKRYNQVFKIYATMTPGFVVRNAMSATFMNKVAGVDNKNILDGIQAAIAYKKHGPVKWLDALGITDMAERELYESAMRSVQATGRGIQSDFVNPTMRGGWADKIANNKATRMLGNANEFTENSVRLPMALDSLRKGYSYDESIMRITQFHFDYTDLSSFDEGMKNFIPFWVWTSRNLPLQFTSMLTRPAYYNAYYKLRERNPAAANIMMPQWINEIGPFGLGGNKVLTPDMPMNRLEQTIGQFISPSKLMGQASPIYKLPIEMIADKQLAMDIPFTDKYEEAKGIDKVIAMLGALTDNEGLGRRNAEGVLEVNPKVTYALGNLLPSIATGQRITGGALGGKSTYNERQLSNIANFLGIPYREVGPRQQRGEAINRQFKIREELQNLAKKGKVEKND